MAEADGRGHSILRRWRAGSQAVLDVLAWVVALTFGAAARYEFDWVQIDPAGLALVCAVVVPLQIATGVVAGLYLGRWRFGSFDEVAALARSIGLTTFVLFLAVNLTSSHWIPRSSVLIAGLTALVLTGGSRYAWRLHLEHIRKPGADAMRLLVFGAGEAATQVVTAMLTDPTSPYRPVALLDDDHGKRNLRIKGVRVEGTRNDLERVAQMYKADALLIAVPSAGAELIGELADRSQGADLAVRVLPSVSELLGKGVSPQDVRPLTAADLLGRRQIDTDVDAIAEYLTDRRVLVTGAGGSIGSELCRQISHYGPERLVMLDRDESALHAVQLSLDGQARLDSDDLVLCDIRDAECVERVFCEHRPQVVFHAAALKHVPILESHPSEAVRTNVFGTLGVLEAAHRNGVERFVNVSTDKAANPANVLGYSKRIAERLTAHFGTLNGGTWLSVRFGNVLGSRGSVLETFKAQIEAGGPVTVTHPEVTRYFMTVTEAVQLVVQAGGIGHSDEVLVLDMGEPVRIASVAERLVAEADDDVEITYTGLRPGEKLHEVLLGTGERDERSVHPLISHVRTSPLGPNEVAYLCSGASPDAVALALEGLAGAEPNGSAHRTPPSPLDDPASHAVPAPASQLHEV